ncbi:MAG: type II secretion system protein GspG [Armatimonadetes bacterium]|nr:type II secretion system protein GspG [Akkermansiaceae bacterium]
MKPNSSSRHLHGFTLIEMLVTITIIVILAGLSVGGFNFVAAKQANEKAKIQISLLSKALEEYKLDNGDYPPTGDAISADGNTGILFKALYYDGTQTPNSAKIYLSELDPAANKQGWTTGTASATTRIIDPWGEPYRYRSGIAADGSANASAQNPDFDLSSKGKDGIDGNADDIKN